MRASANTDDDRYDLSALFLIRARPPLIERVDLIPVRIADMQVNLATGEVRDWFRQRVISLCREVGTTVTGDLRKLSVPVSTTPSKEGQEKHYPEH